MRVEYNDPSFVIELSNLGNSSHRLDFVTCIELSTLRLLPSPQSQRTSKSNMAETTTEAGAITPAQVPSTEDTAPPCPPRGGGGGVAKGLSGLPS